MWLLIDDIRDLQCDLIARTPTLGKRALAYFSGDIECLCLDHDLGAPESGYDVLKWAIEHDLLPSHVQLVTSNPVGRENMKAALINAGYTSSDGINFRQWI